MCLREVINFVFHHHLKLGLYCTDSNENRTKFSLQTSNIKLNKMSFNCFGQETRGSLQHAVTLRKRANLE